MENKELEQKLKQLKTEDFIWLIYIGIILLVGYQMGMRESTL